jgi:hypothetical protein
MSLRVTAPQIKDHFSELGYAAEIDFNAPEAPWENTAVVLRHSRHAGIILVLSIDIYTHRLVEIERRVEGGREATARLAQLSYTQKTRLHRAGIAKLPRRSISAVTDVADLSTLTELNDLVKSLIAVGGGTSEKEDFQRTIDLSLETSRINREINRGSRNSKGSTQQAQKSLRQNF